MEAIALCFMVAIALLAFGTIATPILAHSTNKKERERKLQLLKEHPELAKEIWQSIEEQEAQHKINDEKFRRFYRECL